MAQALDRLGILYQNLIDAGCDEKTVEQCLDLVKEERQADILPLLSRHRTSLLNVVRTGQKQIDCLDFLVYSVEKELRTAER